MKKIIRFGLAWTVGVPFILIALGLLGLMAAVFSLVEDDDEVTDCGNYIKEIVAAWWKWASFSSLK
jgi:hypothetical protein